MKKEDFDIPQEDRVQLPGKAEFAEMMGGDKELCSGILEAAIEDFQTLRTRIESTIGEMDLPATGSALHALRGGASTVEAGQLVSLVRKMEFAVETGDGKTLRDLLTVFQMTMDQHRKALEDLRAQFA